MHGESVTYNLCPPVGTPNLADSQITLDSACCVVSGCSLSVRCVLHEEIPLLRKAPT